jgi:hypothetical protein
MQDTLCREAVKEKIPALLFRQLKPERFSRDEIETLKRQLVPKLPTLCRQLFFYGVLSAKGGYWVVPALGIKIRLSSGDYYKLGNPQRIDDFLALYGLAQGLSFRETVLALRRICESENQIETEQGTLSGSKRKQLEKRRLLREALFGGAQAPEEEKTKTLCYSAMQIRKRLRGYLVRLCSERPGRWTALEQDHPEFFVPRAFARLLDEWSKKRNGPFLRVEEKTRAKNVRYLVEDLTRSSSPGLNGDSPKNGARRARSDSGVAARTGERQL